MLSHKMLEQYISIGYELLCNCINHLYSFLYVLNFSEIFFHQLNNEHMPILATVYLL